MMMGYWKCLNGGCPVRAPIAGDSPPLCYTCGEPMSHVELTGGMDIDRSEP